MSVPSYQVGPQKTRSLLLRHGKQRRALSTAGEQVVFNATSRREQWSTL